MTVAIHAGQAAAPASGRPLRGGTGRLRCASSTPAQHGSAAKHSIVGARRAPCNRVLRLPQALPAPGARQRSLPYPGQLYPTLYWRTL